MKKISILVFVISIFACLFAVNSYAVTCSESSFSNREDHEYTYYWAEVTNSFLVDCKDNTLMRFQYDDISDKMFAEYYTYDYKFVSSKEIKAELPLFGGFYASDDYYFVLTGKTNPNESASVECFRITKYDKSWNRIKSVGLYDCNTTVPFDAGSARFSECGDYLIVRTAHEMYTSSDGLNHQANVTIELNMSTMQITDYLTDVLNTGYGYVSHSFNQFIETENNNIIAVDHGDAYPRSVCLIRYYSDASDGTFTPYWSNTCTVTDMLPIYGNTGANYTGCTVGGFEISPSAYIVVGTSVVQNAEHFYDDVQNVYVSSLSKTTGKVTLTYITGYTDKSAGVPYLVKLSDSSFLLMWEKDGYVYYTKLDAAGAVVGKTYKMKASLSDCEPLLVSGKAVWYVCSENKVDFYSINTKTLSETKKFSVDRGHKYKVTSSDGTYVKLSCSECGKKQSGNVPSAYELYSIRELGCGYYSQDYVGSLSALHPGDELLIWPISTSSDLADTVFAVSDTSVATVTETEFFGSKAYKVKFIKAGSVKLSYSSEYLSEYGCEYTVTVKHSYDSGKVTKKATCSATGVKTYTCTECSATKKTTIAKKAHTYTNACDKTCNVCSATRTISHSYKTTTTKATLTANGRVKTACTVCGYAKTNKVVYYPKTFTLSATSLTYNGKVRTPTVTVKDSAGNVLKKDTDYTVTYASGRKNIGTYKVTVTMKGNYSGTKTLTFKINPINISSCTVKLSATSLTYNGNVRTPAVTVTNQYGTKLTKDTHYTVTYASGRKNVGTYKVSVKMIGNYTGTKTLTFKINPIDISKCTVKLSYISYTYNGSVKTPVVTVTNQYGTKLTKDKHYTVTYASGRKLVGTYKVTVKMIGNYTGTKTLTFKINPPKTTVASLKAGTKSITVNLNKKTTQVTGYQIQYSRNKDFTNAKIKTLTSSSTVKTTLSGLTAAKTYYVRVRTYKTVNNVKYYSGWSQYKYVKTK
ncbi:MAG: fibronectin type III domain-containing protein [Clostridia bacterium]|nr:fibronectin type III domain-containing protein [Clostridia bacterium]